jgi:predicted nucleic acid-binding protein
LIFLDTNIFIYASGYHGESDPRTGEARSLIDQGSNFGFSVQVAHEFYDRVTRLGRGTLLKHNDALDFLNRWRRFTVQPMTLEVFDAAIAIRERYHFRYYDCAIIAAAQALGCDTLYTEDMQHGQKIDRMTIINPFLAPEGLLR